MFAIFQMRFLLQAETGLLSLAVNPKSTHFAYRKPTCVPMTSTQKLKEPSPSKLSPEQTRYNLF